MNARAILPPGRRLRILRRPPESILPSSPRPERRDCHGRLMTALLAAAGPGSEIVDSTLTPWCSATFVGAQHGMTLALNGADASARAALLAARLPEAQLPIPGHVVAELTVDEKRTGPDQARLRLCILTIEAW